MKPDIPWRRFVVEAFVIVGSILLAFTIDAWWEERTDRRDEKIALSRLHTEFQSSTERMGSGNYRNHTASIAILELLQSHQNSSLPLAVPNSMLVEMLGVPTFDRVTPVLDALIQSGNLSLIRNEKVLSSISVWQRDLIQLSEQEQDARRLAYEVLVPALSGRGNLGEPLSINPIAHRSNPINGESLLQVDNVLIGLVADRIRHIWGTIRGMETLRASTESVISAIEQAEEY